MTIIFALLHRIDNKKQRLHYSFALFIMLSFFNPAFAQLEKIASGFQFIEGPVWHNDRLLFSDIPANKIFYWSEKEGKKIFLNASGHSNGLTLDREGNLLMAQHGKRRIAKLKADGTEIALATHYQGKRFNSPNDIAVKSDGSVFFTDPPYGIDAKQEELGFYGIYRITPKGKVQLLDKTLQRPNGIAFSANEKLLYVTDSQAGDIYQWDIVADGTLKNKHLFAHLEGDRYADGLKIDASGKLFVAGSTGIKVYKADGTLLDTIVVPGGKTSNCNWGGKEGKTLFITSGDSLYKYIR
jgi:sugar lactone lactonase YvrE